MFGIAAPPQNSESCGACVAGAIKPALTPPLVDEQPTVAKPATLNTAASKAARPISLKNRPEQQSLSVLAVLQGALFYLDLCSYSFCLFIDFWMGAWPKNEYCCSPASLGFLGPGSCPSVCVVVYESD